MIPRASVVVVTYRSRDTIDACLASLARCRDRLGDLEVVVVDNASGDGTLEQVADGFPWVIRVASSTNLGFTRGVNVGVERTRGDLILLLNPDSEVAPGDLERLLGELEANPLLAVAAPALVDGAGQAVRSCGRFPSLWSLVCDHLGPARWWSGTRLFGGNKYGERRIDALRDVEWASGAALLIRRTAWERVGPLDEGIFMFMEEVDWCRRAAAAGLGVRFVPSARFLHHGGRSSIHVPGESYLHNLRARVYYFRKHHGPLAAMAARAILLASLVAKWLISGLRLRPEPIYARGLVAVWQPARRPS